MSKKEFGKTLRRGMLLRPISNIYGWRERLFLLTPEDTLILVDFCRENYSDVFSLETIVNGHLVCFWHIKWFDKFRVVC